MQNKDKEEEVHALIFLAVGIYVIIFQSFIALKFYNWFIIGHINNAPNFSQLEFLGFIMFISVMIPLTTTKVKKEYQETEVKQLIKMIANPILYFIIGYIIHLFY